MKALLAVSLIVLTFSSVHASKLSHFLNKQHERQAAREQAELRQDMNFQDFAFRLDKRYTDNDGQNCRDYIFRSRSNPYRHGYYTVCEER